MTSTCPECGAKASADQRFCGNCGRRLRSDEGPSRGELDRPDTWSERRRVSVLFIDLRGFTTLAETLDPEDIRALQDGYFDLSRMVVERYGGTIENFIGDAVMAFWGAPRAHEDDAERAVRAALELVTAVPALPGPERRQLRARAAVTTGEAAVTVGDGGQGMLAGDLVNTAARLQHLAPIDGVLVDDTTRRVVGNALTFEPAGAKRLRGKRQEVTTWRALKPAEGADVGRAAGHPGPFVGRDSELGELIGSYQQIVATGQARLVSIIGVAGVGKSRLAWELRQRLEGSAEQVVVLGGDVPAYGEGMTFSPLAEMVRRWSSISHQTPPQAARTQLESAIGAISVDEEERAWLAERISALLSPDPQAAYEQTELFAAWRQFFERIAGESPTVLVFDEMQWAQSELVEFVDHLATWSRRYPLMLITLARPELLDAWPDWASDERDVSLHLAPLPDAAMSEILNALAPELPPDTVREVLARAGGIPLYGVEFARISAAGLADPARVPENLHSLVAARIDALQPRARRLLITASILGRRFQRSLLEAVADLDSATAQGLLSTLIRLELLRVDEESGLASNGDLAFMQDVVREVAYRTLSRRQRRELHLAAADELEQTGGVEVIEIAADHLLNAHRAAPDQPDAPALARRAVAALRQAAARANALHARVPALTHLVDALELTDDQDTRAQLWSEAAPTATAAGHFDEAEQYLRQLITWQTASGSTSDVARTRAQLASLLLATERHASALSDLEDALAAFEDFEADPAGVELAGQLARGLMLVGNDEQAVEWARRALLAAQRLGLPSIAVDALITLGSARAYLGYSVEGVSDLRRAVQQAARLKLMSAELRARNNLAWLVVLDDPHAAMEEAKSGLELATRMGIADMAAHLRDVATVVAIDTGEWDYALTAIREAELNPQAPAHRIALVTSEATLLALQGKVDVAASLIASLQPIDPAIDAQALASVDFARGWIAFIEAAFADAQARARAAAEVFQGADRAAALLLATRAALWQRNLASVLSGRGEIEQQANRGRMTDAGLLTMDAGAAAIGGDETAAALYDNAIARWRELDLPLQLALCLVERDRLLGGGGQEAESILRRLGAEGILALAMTVT